MELSDDHRNRYHKILLDSHICTTAETLKSLFYGELSSYQPFLPEGINEQDRASKLIAYLEPEAKQGRPLLLILLERLPSHMPDDDARSELGRLRHDMQVFFQQTAFDTLLDSYNSKSVTASRLSSDLERILAREEWSGDVLREAYEIARPYGWLSLNPEAQSLSAILKDLEVALPPQDLPPPILIFALYLAKRAQLPSGSDTPAQLINWIGAMGQELQLTPCQIRLLRKYARRYANLNHYYLLITLDAISATCYHFHAEFLDRKYEPITTKDKDGKEDPMSVDTSVPPEKLPLTLEALLKKCRSYLTEKKNLLVVEFALPGNLLHNSVDQWLAENPVDQWLVKESDDDDDMEREKLGVLYQVVVRSLDRMGQSHRYDDWRGRWRILRASNSPFGSNGSSILYCDEEYQQKTFQSFSAELRGSSVVLIPLTFSPVDPAASYHIFKGAYKLGVPAMLWPRKLTGYPDTIDNLYGAMQLSEKLTELPAVIKEMRWQAVVKGNDDHQGHHLTLLWDDPDRVRPLSPLGLPS